MNGKRALDRIRGCLAGVAIGDALGMPVEMMTREQIMKATGHKGVQDLMAPIQTRIGGTRNLPAGATTDDTQLTLAVARSLIKCGEFNAMDQAIELVTEFHLMPFGWGRTTRDGARQLQEYLMNPPARGTGRHPAHPAPPPAKPGQGCGNGVAMKVAPLAAHHALRRGLPEPFLSDVMTLGLMTHGDPRASFAAAALGMILARLFTRKEPGEGPRLISKVKQLADYAAAVLESRYRFFRPNEDDTLSARLERVWGSLGDPDALMTDVGTGCFALESVPYAIGVFLRHPTDFRSATLEAVNAGGDTDSTASMVGALVGANVGLSGIPADWLEGVRTVKNAVHAADRLMKSSHR